MVVQMLASGFLVNGLIYMEKMPSPAWVLNSPTWIAAPLSLCAFMYVNGSTCWLWPHFPLCLESLAGRVEATLSFLLLEVSGHWAYWLVCWAMLLNYMCIKLLVFLLTWALRQGSGKVAGQDVMDGCGSLWQPLSPLGSDFASAQSFLRSDGSKRLRPPLCPHAPWTNPTSPKEVPIVVQQKKFVLAFCVCVWLGFAFQCVFASIKGAYHLTGQSVVEVSCWVLGTAEQAAQRNRERSSFLHLFEQPWPALHVTVGCAPVLGGGPSFFPELPLPAILLLHLHSKVAVSPTALLSASASSKNQEDKVLLSLSSKHQLG